MPAHGYAVSRHTPTRDRTRVDHQTAQIFSHPDGAQPHNNAIHQFRRYAKSSVQIPCACITFWGETEWVVDTVRAGWNNHHKDYVDSQPFTVTRRATGGLKEKKV